jgi:hypothetical protein
MIIVDILYCTDVTNFMQRKYALASKDKKFKNKKIISNIFLSLITVFRDILAFQCYQEQDNKS